MKRKVTVTIMYGSANCGFEMQDRICSYDFDTAAERTAFLLGVDDTVGWMEYKIRAPKSLLPLNDTRNYGSDWEDE